MRLLFLGDVVGKPGRQVVVNHLPDLRARWALDCVIVNGENAAGGFGITESICAEILGAGADVVTLTWPDAKSTATASTPGTACKALLTCLTQPEQVIPWTSRSIVCMGFSFKERLPL